MSFVSKPTDLTKKVQDKKAQNKRGDQLTLAFFNQIEEINSIDYFSVKQVEEIMKNQAVYEYERLDYRHPFPKGMPRFSPSSAGKCERELFYKSARMKKDDVTMYPFQRRWTRNSSSVHTAVQKQILESQYLLKDPAFSVHMLDSGLPAWERNIENFKVITHNGVTFCVFGMCDGILDYKNPETGETEEILFEFKTKSNSVADIKRITAPQPNHIQQATAYKILFGVPEVLFMYESVAKDKWSTGAAARDDFKVFYHKVTDRDVQNLLDKWSRVAMNLQDGEVSAPDFSKCTFCPYKGICNGV